MSKILCTYVKGILDRCAVGLELGSNDGRNEGGDERKEDRNEVGIKLVVEECAKIVQYWGMSKA